MDLITLQRADIRTGGGTQPRFLLSEETIEKYAELLKDGVTFPPLECVYDGSHYWLWDGFTRFNAGNRIGKKEWDVNITQGTLDLAVWLSYGANAVHGLPRSKDETRSAIEKAIAHPNGRGKSNQYIAEHVGVTRYQVRYIRDLRQSDEYDKEHEPEIRIGTNNKKYTILPTKRPKDTPMSVEPEPPLKEYRLEPERPASLLDGAKRSIDKSDFFNLVTAYDALSAVRQRLIEAKSAWETITKVIDTNLDAQRWAKHPHYKSIFKLLQSLPDDILDLGKYLPHTSCIYCKGEGPCEVCNESRWISEQQFEACPPPVQSVNGPTFAEFLKKKVAA